METSNGSQKLRLPISIVGALLWSSVFAVVLTVAFCSALEWRQDVDANSGRLRYQIALGPFLIQEVFEETSFSKLIADMTNTAIPDWRRANTSGVFRSHGRYGFAVSELKRFTIACEALHIDIHDRRTIGITLLHLLQRGELLEMEKLIDDLVASRTKSQAE